MIYNFQGWLKRAGLGEKSVGKHVGNISFFLNEFVVYQDISEDDEKITLCNAEDGIALVDEFLGYFYIENYEEFIDEVGEKMKTYFVSIIKLQNKNVFEEEIFWADDKPSESVFL